MDDVTSKFSNTYVVTGNATYNIVAMVGGKYKIPREVFLQKLPGILQAQENISLVFFLTQVSQCQLFFDVDHAIDLSAV